MFTKIFKKFALQKKLIKNPPILSRFSSQFCLFNTYPPIPMAKAERAPILLLFDVDGTLTPARLKVEPFVWELLTEARKKVYLGIVGGSDLPKQQEQLSVGNNAVDSLVLYLGLMFKKAHVNVYSINKNEMIRDVRIRISWFIFFLNYLKRFINFCLHYIADLDIPIKRGTFVEFRSGMINVSPIGRNCSQEEREEFYKYDQKHKIREKMIQEFANQLPDLAKKLKCSIGGQISFDVFPHGWDKTYCLQFVEKENFKEVHFFGDKTEYGGNDYEISNDKRTISHTVKNPKDTAKIVSEILSKIN
ncbi:hypothetical protein RFI_12657 [Reticulomyxa filosa]|uniref:Phosphomannomutase n=1 Tax=Reticulomyxa filosa TaxID=46433 RepID=X6NEU2_RETFI|nr:hypothetical protein RFI_12657 [Reticulomyxa filosa]|eukprot:ETO24501.1 hypothetical protein RFI_12657 [Reticulomyxa filosa]